MLLRGYADLFIQDLRIGLQSLHVYQFRNNPALARRAIAFPPYDGDLCSGNEKTTVRRADRHAMRSLLALLSNMFFSGTQRRNFRRRPGGKRCAVPTL
jgi:hypothetical protein